MEQQKVTQFGEMASRPADAMGTRGSRPAMGTRGAAMGLLTLKWATEEIFAEEVTCSALVANFWACRSHLSVRVASISAGRIYQCGSVGSSDG